MVIERWLFAAEVAFVLVAVVGISLWSFPAALLVGGVLGMLACERASAGGRAAGGQHGGSEDGGERK